MTSVNTDRQVAALKPRAGRYAVKVKDQRGLYVRVTPSGGKSFTAVARDPRNGKQVWATIGSTELTIGEAREKAREAIKRIKNGLPAVEPLPLKPDTFGAVAANYLERHVKARGLRSEPEIRRILDKHILPDWKDRELEGIRRGDVTTLLDSVQDDSGPRQADYCLAVIRGIMNWQASRSDYVSPITRGMGRVDTKNKKRQRVLNDDEIRAVWKVAEANGQFGAIVRLCLLTAQRREKVASMAWSDIEVDGTWNIQAEDREKGNGGALVLPENALEIIREQKRFEDCPYVFAGRVARGRKTTGGYFKGWSPCKRRFDEKLKGVAAWRVHDLRRTARSLLSRASVRPDIAERVMGHAIQGVEGVYDQHTYRGEKENALERLARLIETILANADKDEKVVTLGAGA
jgi:integrase